MLFWSGTYKDTHELGASRMISTFCLLTSSVVSLLVEVQINKVNLEPMFFMIINGVVLVI